jgi:sec-independent protein translocase protein TatA
MGEGLFQPLHILLIIGIALLLFGPSKFADLGKGLGEGIRNFKSSMKEPEEKPKETPKPPPPRVRRVQLLRMRISAPGLLPGNWKLATNFAQHAPHQRHWQSHHVAVIPFDPRNPSKRCPESHRLPLCP